MLSRLEKSRHLRPDWKSGLRLVRPELGKPPAAITELHDSLGMYLLSRRRPMYRLVQRSRFPAAKRCFAVKEPAKPMNEKVHASALQLFGKPVTIGGREMMYCPPNLEAAFPAIENGTLPVVGHDGEELTDGEARTMVTLARGRAGPSRPVAVPLGTSPLAEVGR
jgi:hypothetical protein